MNVIRYLEESLPCWLLKQGFKVEVIVQDIMKAGGRQSKADLTRLIFQESPN